MTRLRLTLEKYPDNHGKSSRHKDMSFTEVMAYEAERAAKEGRDLGTLGLSTLDRHWRAVKALMEWVSAQDGVPSIDANRLFGGPPGTAAVPAPHKPQLGAHARAFSFFGRATWTGGEPPRGDR